MRLPASLLALAVVACAPAPTTAPTQSLPRPSPQTGSATPLSSPPASVVTFADGKHRVGVDVPPGTYRSLRTAPIAGEEFCYWERTSGLGGSEAEQIANSAGKGSRVVTIGSTDVGFTSTGCGTWTSDLKSSGLPISDGIWIVAVDLAAGTYRSEGGAACVWQRLGGFGGTDNESLGVGEGTLAEIRPTDAGFMSQNCGRWSPA